LSGNDEDFIMFYINSDATDSYAEQFSNGRSFLLPDRNVASLD